MAEKFDPPLEVDLGDNPRKIRFRKIADAKEWAEKDVQAWLEFGPTQSEHLGDFLGRCVASQRRNAYQVLQSIVAAENSDDETFDSAKVRTALEDYRQCKKIHSESTIGKMLLSLMGAKNESILDQKKSAAILAAAMGAEIPVDQIRTGRFKQIDFHLILAGAAIYQNWIAPTPNWAESERASLTEVRRDWAKKLLDEETECNPPISNRGYE